MGSSNENATPKKSRGEVTREQLLEAGLEAFAKYGPEGVTTRQLANAAGVNVAAIAYYFGGKEGYYIAVVKHLIRERAKPVHALLSEISEEPAASERSPEVARKLLVKLIRNLTETILLDTDHRLTTSISSREHLQPTSAFELIYQELVQPLHRMVSELVGCVTGDPPDAAETIARAHVLLGQVLYFAMGSITLCRRMGWDEITKERAERLADIVSEMTERAIG
jgi:TetR/AcrR family transcriptional regulator, regulator of cefoperazone and chloramphenicol sensitivity